MFWLQLLGEKSENVERVRKVSDALKDSQEAGYSVSLQQQDLEKKVSSKFLWEIIAWLLTYFMSI